MVDIRLGQFLSAVIRVTVIIGIFISNGILVTLEVERIKGDALTLADMTDPLLQVSYFRQGCTAP